MAFPTALLMLLVLDSWPVSAARGLVDRLHTYDILAVDVDAEPTADGLAVDCRLRVRATREGPLTFLFSATCEGLSVTRDGEDVPVSLPVRDVDKALAAIGVASASPPTLLTLDPSPALAPGAEATFRLRYRWRPRPGGWYRASARDVETHLSSFWLPAMADEFFTTRVHVRTDLPAFAPGRMQRTADGWTFESDGEQIVALFVADLVRTAGDGCEVWLPASRSGDGEAIARDLAAARKALGARFGPAGDTPFRLVVAEEKGVASYCGGSFAIVKWRPADRGRWIQLIAHEAAHEWFGHRLATPVIGGGGTWFREGLAEWAAIEVAGEIVGEESRRSLWRDRFTSYVSHLDLRSTADGLLFANEPTLLDATYLDPPQVPYFRGALVLRRMARQPGFDERLRTLLRRAPGEILDAREVLAAIGGADEAAYYAGTTRLPDLRLLDTVFEDHAVRATIVCNDPQWPGGTLSVRIDTSEGPQLVDVAMDGGRGGLRWEGSARPLAVEIDPERLHLDPVRSNSVASR